MPLFSYGYSELKTISLKDFFWRLYKKGFEEEDLLSSAAQVAYFFLFALFPLLLFLVSIFGIVLDTAGDLRAEMFEYLRRTMPGSAYDLVQTTIEEVTKNSTGGKLTFGILIALYSASAGVDSIRVALNGVYNLTDNRAFWKTKLLSLAMTLGLGILVTIALGIVLYGSKFTTLILDTINLPIQSPVVVNILQLIIAGVVLILIFALLYNYLPQHRKSSWVWISPGAVIGIVLWVILSFSFRLYLSYFDTYDKTYGSLGAVIVLMLWLYLTALVILIGGSINAVLQEFTDPVTAEAGATQAAAKEIAANPNAPPAKIIADKKAEVLASVSQTSADVTAESKDSDQSKNESSSAANAKVGDESNETAASVSVKKSPAKLALGLVIGLVENIFSTGKKK